MQCKFEKQYVTDSSATTMAELAEFVLAVAMRKQVAARKASPLYPFSARLPVCISVCMSVSFYVSLSR